MGVGVDAGAKQRDQRPRRRRSRALFGDCLPRAPLPSIITLGTTRPRSLLSSVPIPHTITHSFSLAAHRHTKSSSRRMVQCHFDAVIAHEKAIIPYPTPPVVEAPYRLLASTTQNLPKDFAAALFFDTRSTLKRTVFDSGRH